MRLFGKRVGALTEQDMLNLIESRVAESRTLDFKRELPGSSDSAKKDFLADASAFANTSGGVIIYGMDTVREAHGDTGVASKVTGVPGNMDAQKQRLRSMLIDGIEPSLTAGVELQDVVVTSESATVLVLGIAASLLQPHRVTYQRWNRFWRRTEGQRYEPDTTELRSMFLERGAWVEECAEFRAQRIAAFRDDPSLDKASKFLVHLLPLGRLNRLLDINLPERELADHFRPLGGNWSDYRFNSAGFTAIWKPNDQKTSKYTQLFRFGGVEGFSSEFVRTYDAGGGRGQQKSVFLTALSEHLQAYVSASIIALRDVLQVEPPFCLLATLTGVRDAMIALPSRAIASFDERRFDTDELLLPPVVLESDSSVSVECARLTDVIWQAGGFAGPPKS